ncbi:MAG TPA: ABC transporter permease subunit [Solirubrobacteraceae bacterium]|nr:ABC transporter permease subunit [Solirubrobacteraceae bacterium]
MLERLRAPWSDRRAELTLGAVSLLVGVAVVAMIAFVAVQAWPTLRHNGLSFFGSGGDLKEQFETMQNAGPHPPASAYHFRAWPLIWGTLIVTAPAVLLGIVVAVLSSIFIVELAPVRLRRVVIPVVRLLASVPSVIYGLVGILVVVPFVLEHVISDSDKVALQDTVLLNGTGVGVTIVILTIMITPIMIALICEALLAVPNSWREGAIALGCNPVRAMLAVTVRAARPAIVAAAVLATARALGEAIMVSMVGGATNFAPRISDGLTFFLEPFRSVAAAIVDYHEGIGAPALKSALYTLALLLLFSAFVLSVGGYLIKLPMRKYQVRG